MVELSQQLRLCLLQLPARMQFKGYLVVVPAATMYPHKRCISGNCVPDIHDILGSGCGGGQWGRPACGSECTQRPGGGRGSGGSDGSGAGMSMYPHQRMEELPLPLELCCLLTDLLCIESAQPSTMDLYRLSLSRRCVV